MPKTAESKLDRALIILLLSIVALMFLVTVSIFVINFYTDFLSPEAQQARELKASLIKLFPEEKETINNTKLIVTESDEPWAAAGFPLVGSEKFAIVFTTDLLDMVDEYDAQVVLAHEFGHILLGHGELPQLANGRDFQMEADSVALSVLDRLRAACSFAITLRKINRRINELNKEPSTGYTGDPVRMMRLEEICEG